MSTYETPVQAALRADTFDEEADTWRFHGTVIENDERTNGRIGPKLWPAAELEEAAGQLTGRPVSNGHDYDENGEVTNEATVGKVTNDWYDPTTGWRYEMEVGDAELARKLHNDHLEVSFHGGGVQADETDDGHAVMGDIYGKDLAIVPYGGARGNDVNAGAAPDAPASAAALAESVDGPAPVELREADEQPSDEPAESGSGADADTTTNTNMGDDTPNDDPPGIDDLDLDGRVLIDDERHAELTAAESDLEGLKDDNESLKAELEAKNDQIDKVRGVYAAKLAELSGLSEEIFEDKDIEVLEAELAERLDVDEDEAAEAALAAPQTGDGGDGTDPEEDNKVAELREKKEAALEAELHGAASQYEQQIAKLTNTEDT